MSGSLRNLCILAAMSASPASEAWSETRPVFRVGFDGHLAAKGRTGSVEPLQIAGKPEYGPGRFGQALLSGDGGARVAYQIAGHLDPGFGTVSMWVKPLNWRPRDSKMHLFLEAGHGGSGWLLFYKYYQGGMLLFRPQNENRQASYPKSPALEWQAGQWRHIAATWMEGRLQLFIDGELIDSIAETYLPESLGDRFWLGDAGMGDVHKLEGAQTMLDEVCIFDRPLAQAAIRRLARQWTLTVQPEPLQSRWVVEVHVPWAVDGRDAPDAAIVVCPEGSREPVARVAVKTWEQGRASLPVHTARLRPGRYVVRASVEGVERSSVVEKHDPEVLVLENEAVQLSFDAGTGGLVGLRNKRTRQVCRPVERVSQVFALNAVDYDRHSRSFAKQDWQRLDPSQPRQGAMQR